MRFVATEIPGCAMVEIEPHQDERGFFARTWCRNEFAGAGFSSQLVQCSVSRNRKRGTLRGMHFQLPPSCEGKLVRCTRGAIVDVVVDLRSTSPCYLDHVSVELTADNGRAVFIPPGCAHGFQTLEDNSDVFYQMTDVFAPELAAGLRWNDPALAIDWPVDSPIMNQRDRNYPDLDRDWLGGLSWD
ncbi:MAG: dTDP-4-dehydrorhamnose 3,5-epimerase [Gammaproteobacteria bacterium]|nr:dTDP-4-dehydrorhamnose 3,5-epimerase [Gammaproteobacteria bacterium]